MELVWRDPGLPPKEEVESSVYSLAIREDGLEMIAGVCHLVLVYSEGDLKKRLRGHKGNVYAVCYSKKGMFASGGADKTVIVWNAKCEGILKFSHGDSIQCLCFFDVGSLLSCTSNDFGVWSESQKSVTKHKSSQMIRSCACHDDGRVAFGLARGLEIRIHKKIAKFFERSAPVWCCAWTDQDLIGACWDFTLLIVKKDFELKERKIDFFASAIVPWSPGLVLVSGSDCRVSMYTTEGKKLKTLYEDTHWTWSLSSTKDKIAVGSWAGHISSHSYKEDEIIAVDASDGKVAHREHLTQVVYEKKRIKCNDYVRALSLYQNRLAVQLADRVVVYDANGECEVMEELSGDFLVLTSKRVLVASGHQIANHEWSFSSQISFMSCIGGPSGKECVLVGFEDLSVSKLFVDNPFPIEIWPPVREAGKVTHASLNLSSGRLLVLSSKKRLVIVKDCVELFALDGISGAAWSDAHLIYSNILEDKLSVRYFDDLVVDHDLNGRVVGATPHSVIYPHGTTEIPHSKGVMRLVEMKRFSEAYSLAQLSGISSADWRRLAAASSSIDPEVARNAYARLKDLGRVEAGPEELLALDGHYREAAKAYVAKGDKQKAVQLFVDLKMWKEAKSFGGDLKREEAEWVEECGDAGEAAELWIACGNFQRAIDLLIEKKRHDDLKRISLNLSDEAMLKHIATYFKQHEMEEAAEDLLKRLGDSEELAKHYVEKRMWKEAMDLQFSNNRDVLLLLPYARYLAEEDRFDEALDAYRSAGKPKEAQRMMEELTANAICESRFGDAAYYHFLRSNSVEADAYYAYSFVETYFHPFTPHSPEIIFNAARFLLNRDHFPDGISRIKVLHALARNSQLLGAFKLARETLDRLAGSTSFSPCVEDLSIYAKPMRDNPDLLPVCYRCGSSNSLLTKRDECTTCGHPFVRSFLTFDILPLIQFTIDDDITEQEALDLIRQHPPKEEEEEEDSSFGRAINRALAFRDYVPISADRNTLQSLRREQIYHAPPFFYKAVLEDTPIAVCENRFYNEEDFEFFVLKNGRCPFSRSTKQDTGSC